LYYDFYKASDGITISVRRFILSYINYFYICRHIEQLSKRKLRYLVKLNIIWGNFPLSAKSIYKRLISNQTREKLKSIIFKKNKRNIYGKINKLRQILQIQARGND
jgi:hypothetical protein